LPVSNSCPFSGAIALADGIKNSGAMTSLDISNNHLQDRGIRAVCDAIRLQSPPMIKYLNVQDNQASNSAAKWLVTLPYGIELHYENGNVFNQRGKQQLQRWEAHGKLLENGSVPVAHFKVHLCGNQAAGKTKLRKALARFSDAKFMGMGKRADAVAKDNPYSRAERTVGMEIQRVKRGGIDLCLCDYGGQPEFHFQHAWFIPCLNGLYVIVVNLQHSKDEQKQEICYWLHFIQTCCAGSACVALVGSRADVVENRERKHRELVELAMEIGEELGERLPTLDLREWLKSSSGGVFVADCRSAEDIGTAKLRTWLLERCTKELAEAGAPRMPKVCQDIREELNSVRQNQPIMSWLEYAGWVKQITRHSTLEDTLLEATANYLHDLGEIIFINKGSLGQWVFLDPPLLCQQVLGKLLSPDWFLSRKVAFCMSGDSIAKLVGWTACNADTRVLVTLLSAFGLCYSIELPPRPEPKREEDSIEVEEQDVENNDKEEQRENAAAMMGAAYQGKARRDEIRKRNAAVTTVQAMYRGANYREFDITESHNATKQKSANDAANGKERHDDAANADDQGAGAEDERRRESVSAAKLAQPDSTNAEWCFPVFLKDSSGKCYDDSSCRRNVLAEFVSMLSRPVCIVQEDHELQGSMGTLKMEVSALLADRKYEVKISDRSRNFLGSSLRRKLVISPSFLFWLC
jgi:hypothetical protein